MKLLSLLAPSPDAEPLSDPGRIDSLYRRHRWTIMTTLVVSYGFFYTCRLGLSVAKGPLIDQGIFDAKELGWIGLATFWSYAIGKLGCGFLADRVNVRLFLAVGLGASAVLNLVMGSSDLVAIAIVVWGLNGLFQGVGNPSCVVTMTRWFGRHEHGTMYGIWSSAHAIGEGVTFWGTGALVAATMWRAAFWGPGVACLGIAILAFVLIRERPTAVGLPAIEEWKHDPEAPGGQEQAKHSSTLAMQLSLLKLPSIWILGLASAAMYVTRYSVTSWGVFYLEKAHGLATDQATFLVGLNAFAGIGGCIAYGFVSDRFFKSHRPPATLIFGLLEIGALLLIFTAPTGHTMLLSLGFIIYGFTLSGILAVLGGLFAVDIAPKDASGAAMGIMGIFSYVGGGLQDVVSGILIEDSRVSVGGVEQFDFAAPIAFWVGASVVSMALAASLWRVRPRG